MSAQLDIVSVDDGFFPVILAKLASHVSLDVTVNKGAKATTLTLDGTTYEGNVAAARALAKVINEKDASLNLIDDSTESIVDLCATELYNKKDTIPKIVKEFDEKLADKSSFNGTNVTLGDLAAFAYVHTNKRWPIMLNKQKADTVTPNYYAFYKKFTTETSTPVYAAAKAAYDDFVVEENQAKEAKLKASKTGSFEIDLPGAADGKVVTRFPPEPSGYLHIGHAKALLLNHYFAERFKGKMILRFDDTNPSKEKDEYVENIMQDLKTLEVKWDGPTHTSDYFDVLLDYAKQLIKQGQAYVDDTPVEQMRAERMAKIESKARSNSVEENMRLFEEMIQGTEHGVKCVLRAKIDMSSSNGCMRDPTIYRCNDTPHHRTGTKYKLYPTYDFCCPIVDSIEGVTHTLRTIEYHDRNHQYNWVCDALGLRKPHIWDFSRLNFVYTLLSKRNLQWFVDNGHVEGWFDPRFPTVQGIMRRGLLVKSLKEFMISQGASKNINLMEWDKLWALNKSHLEPVAPRYTAVVQKDAVVIELTDITEVTKQDIPLHQKNPAVGKKTIIKNKTVLIEQSDAKNIKDGEEITLMTWGNIICDQVIKNEDGVVTKIIAHTNLGGDVKKTALKASWIGYESADYTSELVPLNLIEYGNLITVKKVEDNMKVEDIVNTDSVHMQLAYGEQAMSVMKKDDIIQIQRKGFYRVDAVPTADVKEYQLIFIPDGTTKK